MRSSRGRRVPAGRSVCYSAVESKDPVYLCALVPEQCETCHMELEFDEEEVTFSVIGQRSVHLVGYYIAYPLRH